MTALATAIFSLISLALLWVFIFWVYRDFCVESFRQRVFALRDEFFDMAADGKIRFNHKSYGRLRLTMNGAIRFADDISFVQIVLMSYFNRSSSVIMSYKAALDNEIRDLPAGERNIILNFQDRLNNILIGHLLVSSPIAQFILVPLIIYFPIKSASAWIKKKLVSWTKEHFKTPLDEMQSLAYAVGND
jgi:hypothetical protein